MTEPRPLGVEDQTKPADRKTRFRFRIRSVLLLMIPLGIGFLWLAYFLDNRPIEWEPYSESLLEQRLDEERLVIVFVRAEWDMSSAISDKFFVGNPEVISWVRRNDVASLELDFSDLTTRRLRGTDDALGGAAIWIYSPGKIDNPVSLEIFRGLQDGDYYLNWLREAKQAMSKQ